MGTFAVLAIKQEPLSLIMPAQAAVQNQQEVFVVVQRSLEASVFGGIITDKSSLKGAPPQQSPFSMTPPVSSLNPPQI